MLDRRCLPDKYLPVGKLTLTEKLAAIRAGDDSAFDGMFDPTGGSAEVDDRIAEMLRIAEAKPVVSVVVISDDVPMTPAQRAFARLEAKANAVIEDPREVRKRIEAIEKKKRLANLAARRNQQLRSLRR